MIAQAAQAVLRGPTALSGDWLRLLNLDQSLECLCSKWSLQSRVLTRNESSSVRATDPHHKASSSRTMPTRS